MNRPPFCPHHGCRCHHAPDSPAGRRLAAERWYRRDGFYRSALRGRIPRFRCRHCRRGFSAQSFALDYFAKRHISYAAIEQSVCTCRGVRATARALRCSPDSVVNRCSRLARQSIAAHAQLLAAHRLTEPLAADGFESFAVSQYWPANIHLLLGCRSQFVFFAEYVTIRRKGRMSAAQKGLRAALERLSPPSPGALTASFTRLLDCVTELAATAETPVVLHTDEKREYRRAVIAHSRLGAHPRLGRRALFPPALLHRRTSSRAARTRSNPLFAVNYIDRELRKDLAEHVRETVRFARNVNHLMERLWVYLLNHNLRKPYRINDPRRLWRTHASVAGFPAAAVAAATRRLYHRRRFRSFAPLSPALETAWLRRFETPLRGAAPGLLRRLRRAAAAGPVDLAAVTRELAHPEPLLPCPQYLPAYVYS